MKPFVQVAYANKKNFKNKNETIAWLYSTQNLVQGPGFNPQYWKTEQKKGKS
jgi:hypothetical protein